MSDAANYSKCQLCTVRASGIFLFLHYFGFIARETNYA